LLGGLAGKLAGTPVVWNIRCSPDVEIGRASRTLARISGMLACVVPDFIINCSARSAEQHARLGFGSANRAVVPNGYDPTALRPDDAAEREARQALGISPDTFLVGSISRWIGYKDIPTLLAALRLTRERGIEGSCILIGTGLDAGNADLMAAIRGSHASGDVIALGKRNDIPDLARALDLHVLTSTTEAFPNVVAETMLSGTPNATTDVGDAALIVGDTGWIVPPGDAHKLAEAIASAWDEWRNRPDHWQRRRLAARRRVADQFSLERMVRAYEDVWRLVAAGRVA
jgi:glycosyltransferase involved in cell wall biosynthesis